MEISFDFIIVSNKFSDTLNEPKIVDTLIKTKIVLTFLGDNLNIPKIVSTSIGSTLIDTITVSTEKLRMSISTLFSSNKGVLFLILSSSEIDC